VDDVDLEQLLQVALLRRRQLLVEDHDVDVEHLDELPQLLGLALADERGGVGRLPPLDGQLDRVGAGGVGQQGQLRQRGLRLVEADVAAAHQQGPLPDDAEVDLGGGQAPPLPSGVGVVGHSTPPASGTVSASRSSSTSTSNTKATGPPSRTLKLSPRPLGCRSTTSSPPGTRTVIRPGARPRRWAAPAAAHAPDPHDAISPTPRSQTRIRRPEAVGTATSTLVRLGKRTSCSSTGPCRSSGTASGSSTKITKWGLPTPAASPR